MCGSIVSGDVTFDSWTNLGDATQVNITDFFCLYPDFDGNFWAIFCKSTGCIGIGAAVADTLFWSKIQRLLSEDSARAGDGPS